MTNDEIFRYSGELGFKSTIWAMVITCIIFNIWRLICYIYVKLKYKGEQIVFVDNLSLSDYIGLNLVIFAIFAGIVPLYVFPEKFYMFPLINQYTKIFFLVSFLWFYFYILYSIFSLNIMTNKRFLVLSPSKYLDKLLDNKGQCNILFKDIVSRENLEKENGISLKLIDGTEYLAYSYQKDKFYAKLQQMLNKEEM